MLRFWDVRSSRPLLTLSASKTALRALAYNPVHDELVACAAIDGALSLCAASSAAAAAALRDTLTAEAAEVRLAARGKKLGDGIEYTYREHDDAVCAVAWCNGAVASLGYNGRVLVSPLSERLADPCIYL